MPKSKVKQPVRENVFQDGPYLQTAVLCERVLDEKDGVKSAIRIVDRFTKLISAVGPEEAPLPTLPPMRITPTLLVRLKKGNTPKSRFEVRIDFAQEDGRVQGSQSHTVIMEGTPDRGMDLVALMALEFDKEGLYWINVYVDDYLLTRVPIRVVFLVQKTIVPGPGGRSKPVH